MTRITSSYDYWLHFVSKIKTKNDALLNFKSSDPMERYICEEVMKGLKPDINKYQQIFFDETRINYFNKKDI